MNMHRTQICLTNPQYKNLIQLAEVLGISMAEYIRRILDKHLEKVKYKIDNDIPIGVIKDDSVPGSMGKKAILLENTL